MNIKNALNTAVALALTGKWDDAHRIVQEYGDPTACWIHAVLHKIEGDAWNSRYWYARTHGRDFADYDDAQAELREIEQRLNAG